MRFDKSFPVQPISESRGGSKSWAEKDKLTNEQTNKPNPRVLFRIHQRFLGESMQKVKEKRSTSKSEICMLKYERKQGNWAEEHLFGLTFFFSFGTFFWPYCVWAKNAYFS